MKTIDEILDEWEVTIPDEEHNGLYARDKVKLIAREFADQFSQDSIISSSCECKGYGSNIFDRNGVEVKVGQTLVFPYITPFGELTNNIGFKAKVQFKYGCFGYETKTSFIPLMEWMEIEKGEYVPNSGNKKIYTEKYPFWVES